MTKVGYDHIISIIKERKLFPPDGLTTDQMIEWLNGYTTCQNDILTLLEALKNEDGH